MPYEVGYDDDADPFIVVFCAFILFMIFFFERGWYKCACCRKQNIKSDLNQNFDEKKYQK
jgi:hypothetical protein